MRRYQFTPDEYNKLSIKTGVPAVELQNFDPPFYLARGLLLNSICGVLQKFIIL